MEDIYQFSIDKIHEYREGNLLEVKSAKGGLPASLWGSGLQGIFHTWEKVFHTKPEIKSTSEGVDRTTLSLDFNGQQPDIKAMLTLYDNPELISFDALDIQNTESTQESKGESTQENSESTQENPKSTQESSESTQENSKSTQEIPQSNKDKILYIIKTNPTITLEEVAKTIGLTRDGVKKTVDKLKAEGLVAREGATKKDG